MSDTPKSPLHQTVTNYRSQHFPNGTEFKKFAIRCYEPAGTRAETSEGEKNESDMLRKSGALRDLQESLPSSSFVALIGMFSPIWGAGETREETSPSPSLL